MLHMINHLSKWRYQTFLSTNNYSSGEGTPPIAAHISRPSQPPPAQPSPHAAASLQQQQHLTMSTGTAAHGDRGLQYHQNQLHQHPRGRRAHRSGPLEWTAAVVFTVLAIVVLIAAVAVLVVVLLLQPRAPYLAIRSARLDGFVYDQMGTLEADLSLGIAAENGNARSEAAFSELELRVAFHRMVIAILRADPFDVPPKGSLPLGYVARSSGIPLDGAGMAAMEAALADGVVPFSVAGQARTRWKVGGLVPFKYWTRLRCDLRFFWPNGTALDLSCSSKPKSKSKS